MIKAELKIMIESKLSICREDAKNVKRWRDGTMALRWCAAGVVETGRQFRRVNGHLHLPLHAALVGHVGTGNVSAGRQNEALTASGRPGVSRNSGRR